MKTHWKKLTNPDYIGAYSLNENENRTVEITSVSREMIVGAGGKKEECTVAFLKAEKPMILNVTNCKTITKVLKTPFIEEWAGKSITIYAEIIHAFGDTVSALRVRTTTSLPELIPTNTTQWRGAIEALKSGKFTMAQIKTKYTLSDENEKALIVATT